MLSWVKENIYDKRIIGSNNLTDMYTWIDTDYAVLRDMRSHAGGSISMGHGLLCKKKLVQRLNTKCSMEAELVGVSEYLTYNLWLFFLHGKENGIMNNIVYQDNQISIRVKKNGRNSCNGKSRHINNIRYYFVKYRVDKREVKIEYCPTQMMLAYYFTKILKGEVFKIFRDIIMGCKTISPLESIPVSIKECVRNYGKRFETIFDRKRDVALLSH